MKVIIPAAYVFTKESKPYHIGFRYQKEYADSVHNMLEVMRGKRSEQLRVELSIVRRARSTGKGSQNNHVWGHCTDIADHLSQEVEGQPEVLYTASEVEQAMLRMAVDDGYPTKMSVDGREIPKPFSQATVEEAKLLIDIIHRYADEHEIPLTEIDPDTKLEYQSIGGRTKEGMVEYNEEKWRRRQGANL